MSPPRYLPTKLDVLAVQSLERRAYDLKQQARMMREGWALGMLKAERPVHQVYQVTGVSFRRIAQIRSLAGMSPARGGTVLLEEQVLEAWDTGQLPVEIAKTLGCALTFIKRVLLARQRVREPTAVDEVRYKLNGLLGMSDASQP